MSQHETFSDIPAFPSPNEFGSTFQGLTKREYFAAIALQGLLANTNFADGPHNAELAVAAADALIAELNREQGGQH